MFGRRDAAEQRFVREALLSLGSERPGLRGAARAVRDWGRVLAIAAAGSVAESIWSGVSLRGAEAEIPEPARTALREAHEGATARNALLLSEAAAIQASFQAAGIESVILKGPGLLVAHYPDIGGRHVGDVDILVRPADADRADAVAREQGARPMLKSDGSAEGVPGGHHHLAPLVTTRGVLLEIHTGIPGGVSGGASIDDVMGSARDVPWKSRSLRIPSGPDLAAMACLHVFEGHGGLDDYLSRHLADIAVLIDSGATDWDAVAKRLPQGSGSIARIASWRQIEDGRTDGAAWRYVIGVRGRQMMKVAARGDPGEILELVFPPRAYMAWKYGVPEASRIVPALYLWRPIRGAWRFVTGR